MYTENELWFNTYGTPQVDTTVAAHISDNVYDKTTVDNRYLKGGFWVFTMTTALLLNATGTFRVQLVCSAAAALTTPTALYDSGTIAHDAAEALFVVGNIYKIPMPIKIPLRYIGCIYTIGTAVATTGAWESYVVPNAYNHLPNDPTATS